MRVCVVVDGFGSKGTLARLREWMPQPEVELVVFRPVDSWWSLLQPGQLRRLHQKLCAVDGEIGFVGGINIIDDRIDLRHGSSDAPRLDFAVEVRGPVAASAAQSARAVWTPRRVGRRLARGDGVAGQERAAAGAHAPRAAAPAHGAAAASAQPQPLQPVVAAFVVRDNLRQRRSIERAYIEAVLRARERVDLVTPYFYPGRAVPARAVPRRAARRARAPAAAGQDRLPLRRAWRRRCCTTSCAATASQIYEYTPAFLHAKVALVDDEWATVGSSNIDPLSLLLNLEANVIVHDADFTRELSQRFDAAIAVIARGHRRLARPSAGARWCCAASWPGAPTGSCAWPASRAATDLGQNPMVGGPRQTTNGLRGSPTVATRIASADSRMP